MSGTGKNRLVDTSLSRRFYPNKVYASEICQSKVAVAAVAEVGLYLGSGLGLVISNRPHVECAASYGLHVYYALILLFVYWI